MIKAFAEGGVGRAGTYRDRRRANRTTQTSNGDFGGSARRNTALLSGRTAVDNYPVASRAGVRAFNKAGYALA